MANNLSKSGITTSATAEAWHVTQSIDALTGVEAYNITISGSLNLTGSAVTGSFSGDGSQLTGIDSSSYASTASYAVTASYAENGGGGSSLWYDGTTYLSSSKDVQITGSLGISGSIHIVADNHTEFTISGSNASSTFNLTNENSAGAIVINTAGVGSIFFGTNGNTNEYRMYPGGHLWLTGGTGPQNIWLTGDVSASGDLYGDNLIVATDITASGDISASAGIVLGGVRKTSWPAGGTGLWYDGGTYLSSSLPIKVDSDITASGNISSSGNLYGDRLYAQAIKSLVGPVVQISDNLDVVGHITASGNISSSGKFIGKIDATDTNYNNSHYPIFVIDDQADPSHLLPFTSYGFNFNPGTDTLTVGAGGINTSGNISASGDLKGYNISSSNAFHAVAHAGYEFTVSGSHFNMRNQSADRSLWFMTTDGTGVIGFGTDGNNGEFIIGTGGHITASGNISSSGDVYGVTGSFSHIVGASPLIIKSDNFNVDSSGNISGSGTLDLRKNLETISNAAGERTITMTEANYPPNTLITLDLENEDAADVDFTLPAQTEGLEYTFVVKVGNGGGANFSLKSPGEDTLQGMAYCSNEPEILNGGNTFTVEAGETNIGDRFNVISDGVNWYLTAYTKCETGAVSIS